MKKLVLLLVVALVVPALAGTPIYYDTPTYSYEYARATQDAKGNNFWGKETVVAGHDYWGKIGWTDKSKYGSQSDGTWNALPTGRGWIQHDLSAFAGTQDVITDGKLRIFNCWTGVSGNPLVNLNRGMEFTFHRALASWDYNTLTYANSPAFEATPFATWEMIGLNNKEDQQKWAVIDGFTDAIKNWVSGAWDNYGYMVEMNRVGDGSDPNFFSSTSWAEFTYAGCWGNDPLPGGIDYVHARETLIWAPEPATILLLGLGGLLFRRRR